MEEKKLENPKIFSAISGVIADCGFVAKDKVNKQQGFKYRSVDDVFNALHPALSRAVRSGGITIQITQKG